jgi:hypothetical protein
MCPFCKDKPCKVVERPDGRLACECGRHSWPNAAVYAETLRRENLTIVNAVHNWTQSF